MKHKGTKVLALLLVVVMLLGVIPAPVLAAEPEAQPPEDRNPIILLDMEDISDNKVRNLADGAQFSIGGQTKEQVPSGNGSKALRFDGRTSFLDLGKTYQVRDDFTLAAWVKTEGSRGMLIRSGRLCVPGEIGFDLQIWQNTIFRCDFSDLDFYQDMQNRVSQNTWHHVAVVRQGTHIQYYLDGVLKETYSCKDQPITDYTTDLLVGAALMQPAGQQLSLANDQFFKGAMDELRVYQVALTAEEVTQLAAVKSDAAQITDFTLPGQIGTAVIREETKTITVTMPKGASLTAAPTITVSGKATVSPASGTEQDFSVPVTYTVTAENGNTAVYTVQVEVQEETISRAPIVYLDMETIENGKVKNLADGTLHPVVGNSAQQVMSANGTMALRLDGTSNYVDLGRAYQLDTDFTLATWVKLDLDKNRGMLFRFGRLAVQEAGFGVSVNTDKKLQYDTVPASDGLTMEAGDIRGQWHHVALTRQGTQLQFYLDGEKVNGRTCSTSPVPMQSTNLWIGGALEGQDSHYCGEFGTMGAMDEVRIYSVALTADEVAELVQRVSDEKKIIRFDVPGQMESTILEEQHIINVTLPEGTDVTALTPTIAVSEKAAVSPASGEAQNFTNPVTYTVTGENGTTVSYVVSVELAKPETDPYLKQDGTPVWGLKEAIRGKRSWMENTEPMPVEVIETADSLTMQNGAISRTFHLPEVGGTGFYTASFANSYIEKELMTGEAFPEIYLGLYDKPYGEVFDRMEIKEDPTYYFVGGKEGAANTFVYDGYEILNQTDKPFEWERMSKPYSDPAAGQWPVPGKHVEFKFKAGPDFPAAYQGITIKVIYEMYDNCAVIKKRVEITNTGDQLIMIGRLAPEALRGNQNMEELLCMEYDYINDVAEYIPVLNPPGEYPCCYCMNEKENSPFRELVGLKHTCYDVGPAYELKKGETLTSFNTFELVFSTYWFEQQCMERMTYYRKVFPWTTDNPRILSVTKMIDKDLIDHAAEGGFDIILTAFGTREDTHFMTTRDEATIQKYRDLVEYAKGKNIELGMYQPQWRMTNEYRKNDQYGGNDLGIWGGGTLGFCMASAAFDDYWSDFHNFVEQTGFVCLEVDGPWSGNACNHGEDHVNKTRYGVESKYKMHHGYYDSKVMQWENGVRMMYKEFRDLGCYLKIPEWLFANGSQKIGIGYEEEAWSAPRQEQLIYGRQVMHLGAYTRTAPMSCEFVPFVQYHGGGNAATFEPFSQKAFDYNWVMAQCLGNGITSDFRGTALYDAGVKPILDRWVNFYNRYRGIACANLVHIKQAEYGSNRSRTTCLDTLYHVDANNPGEKGLLWVYNQSDETRTETITVPMFYTGLTTLSYPSYPLPGSLGKRVHDYGTWPPNHSFLPDIREYELPAVVPGEYGKATFVHEGLEAKDYTIDSNGNVMLEVTMEPMTFTYFTVYRPGEAPTVEVTVDAVTGLQVQDKTTHSVKLTWDPDTSYTVTENGVVQEFTGLSITGYNIYRDGELIGSSLSNAYEDKDVTESKTYTYTVKAKIGEIEGAAGEALTVTTEADRVAPALVQVTEKNKVLTLTFTEPMDKTAAEQTGHYTLTGGATVTKAELSADGKTVTLSTEGLQDSTYYELTIKNLKDASAAGNALNTVASFVVDVLGHYPMDTIDQADGQKILQNTGGEAGVVYGAAITTGTGKNGCLYLNAADMDYVDLGVAPMNNRDTYSIRLAFWPNEPDSAARQTLLSAGQQGHGKKDLSLYLEGGKLTFHTSNDQEQAVSLTSRDALLTDSWNQVVVTRRGEAFKLYLNGKLQAEQTAALGTYQVFNALSLGAMTGNGGGDRTFYFNGRLDELYLYAGCLEDTVVQAAWKEYQPYNRIRPLIWMDFEDMNQKTTSNAVNQEKYTFVGNPVITDRDGSKAVKLDGSSYLNLGSEGYQLGGEFTASAWVKVATTNDNHNHKIFCRGYTTKWDNEFSISIRNLGYNNAATNADHMDSSPSGMALQFDFDRPQIALNQWCLYTVVCDGTTVKVYKDGVLHNNMGTAKDINLIGNPHELLIGHGWNSDGSDVWHEFGFKGELDNVILYDMALSQAEVQKLLKPQAEPAIENYGQSLSLDDNIFVNSYVTVTGFENVDVEANGGMLIWNEPVTEEEAVITSETAVNKAGLMQITTKEGDVVYGQQTDGIVSTDYAKILYLRSYVKNTDGTYTYGPLTRYSVRTYVDKAIAQNSTAKDAAIELAHFGAAAQLYFGRNLDKLANSGMEQYPAGEFKPEYLDALADFTTSIQASGNVTYKGKTLSLDDRIMMNFYFMPDGFDVKTAELLIWDGVTGELTEANATKKVDMTLTKQGYGAQALGFAADEYGKTIFVCAKMTDANGEAHYSQVVAASPESYAKAVIDANTNETLVAAVRQMVVYGEAAGIYLAEKQ